MSSALGVHRFANRVARIKPSAIREILKAALNSEMISFAGGLPAAELFPVDGIAAATERVLSRSGAAALQYSTTEGMPELREWVAARLNARHATSFDPQDVVITAGSQQALDLFAKVFIDPGDTIVVENPSYLGAIQAFDAYEPRYLAIETDAHGIVPDSLEHALSTERPTPKFLYLTPNYQNPTGVTLAAARRAEVVAIAEQYNVPVFEDDPYGDINFERTPLPPLIAHAGDATIVYGGTSSKMVAPGLRVAWMVIPDREVREKVVHSKQGMDLHTGTFAQHVLHAYVTDGDALERHLELVRTTYAARRNAMRDALREFMPDHVRFNAPDGGMFFWATVDPAIDTQRLFETAIRQNVVFVPGRPFYPYQDRGDGMRLNFSASNEDRIRTGVERLAQAIRACGD